MTNPKGGFRRGSRAGRQAALEARLTAEHEAALARVARDVDRVSRYDPTQADTLLRLVRRLADYPCTGQNCWGNYGRAQVCPQCEAREFLHAHGWRGRREL